MKACCLRLCKAFLFPGLILGVSLVTADEPAAKSDAPERKVYHHDRPESERGWVVVSKESYWSLCYESLDRLQETRELIGKASDEEIATALDKDGCWLSLAASAALTDGRSGIVGASELFEEAAEDRLAGGSNWSDGKLNDLVTLGLVCMAKSHVLRANQADESFKATRASANTTTEKTDDIKQIEKEINEQSIEQGIAQYRYDMTQSRRHLEVAQVYLEAAAKSGGFKVDDSMLAEIPDFANDLTPWQLTEFTDDELRPRIDSMGEFVEATRKTLVKKLSE